MIDERTPFSKLEIVNVRLESAQIFCPPDPSPPQAGEGRIPFELIQEYTANEYFFPVDPDTPMNITLIGMPGSGKSFIGRKLAKQLNYEFIEPDKMLESKYGLSLQHILEKLGEKPFLEEEANATIINLDSKNNFVVSPGGSIVYRNKAMRHLQKISTIIYLKTIVPTLEKRIGVTPRGIVGLKKITLDELSRERTPLYEKWSAVTVDADQSADIIVKSILHAIDPSAPAAH